MCVLLCFIDPRVRKIRNEASSFPGIFHFYYVASSPNKSLTGQPHANFDHDKFDHDKFCHGQNYVSIFSPDDARPL